MYWLIDWLIDGDQDVQHSRRRQDWDVPENLSRLRHSRQWLHLWAALTITLTIQAVLQEERSETTDYYSDTYLLLCISGDYLIQVWLACCQNHNSDKTNMSDASAMASYPNSTSQFQFSMALELGQSLPQQHWWYHGSRYQFVSNTESISETWWKQLPASPSNNYTKWQLMLHWHLRLPVAMAVLHNFCINLVYISIPTFGNFRYEDCKFLDFYLSDQTSPNIGKISIIAGCQSLLQTSDTLLQSEQQWYKIMGSRMCQNRTFWPLKI